MGAPCFGSVFCLKNHYPRSREHFFIPPPRRDTHPFGGLGLRELGQRGITRWWNDLAEEQRITPDGLLNSAETNGLGEVGMSAAVQQTFFDSLTSPKKRELASLRCKDVYILAFKMDAGTYCPLELLSGGQRVNLLLTLLLETNDERPLAPIHRRDECGVVVKG